MLVYVQVFKMFSNIFLYITGKGIVKPNGDNFIWGVYDVVLDAAWMVMNLIHGHFYRILRKNANEHRLNEYVVERLWTKELIFRCYEH